jgi:hypothetical protein
LIVLGKRVVLRAMRRRMAVVRIALRCCAAVLRAPWHE